MNTLLLNPIQKQLFQVQPQHSHPRLSILRVLHVRFCRWLDKASWQAVWKAVKTVSTLLLVSSLALDWRFTLGLLTWAARWNSYKIPIFLAALFVTLNVRRIVRWLGRSRLRRNSKGNQYAFCGLPIGDLAQFLKRTNAWKHDEAMHDLGISEGQWEKVGETLEKHGILVRGSNNARVLREIGLAMLVRQLRDDFPLVYDDISKTWVEKDDPYGRFLREKSFRTRKLEEETARTERKAERAEKKLEAAKEELEEVKEEASTFNAIMALPG